MKKITLTQGQTALVDDEDYDYLSQWKDWYAVWAKNSQSYYAERMEKYPTRHHVRMHRLVMNTPENLVCDHINHNTIDNRKQNLRNVTRSQNSMNRKTPITNKLGEKGINLHSDGRGFQVKVRVKGHCYGHYHVNLESAISERDSLLEKHHGEFRFIMKQRS